MVSLPPGAPQQRTRNNQPNHVAPEAVNAGNAGNAGKGGGRGVDKLPETVRYLVASLSVMLGAELVHQLVAAATVLIDPGPLRESARKAAEKSGEQVSGLMINLSVYSSVAMMLAFQLVVVGLLAVAVRAVARRAGWAPNALRLLQFFGIYFAIRAGMLFLLTPDSAAVPVAFYAVDGALQIIAGAAGACAVAYAMQDQVHNHVRKKKPGAGPTDPPRTGSGNGKDR